MRFSLFDICFIFQREKQQKIDKLTTNAGFYNMKVIVIENEKEEIFLESATVKN